MFKKLFDYKFIRSPIQAAGFYFAYLLLMMLLSGLIGAMVGAAGLIENWEHGITMGSIIAAVACPILSFAILKAKRAFSMVNVILAFLSGFLSIFFGGVLGLIPVAFLTTRRTSGTH